VVLVGKNDHANCFDYKDLNKTIVKKKFNSIKRSLIDDFLDEAK